MYKNQSLCTAYIGLGSNLSNPKSQVLKAYESMGRAENINTLILSPLYQTKAIGPGDQPDYINAVAKIETTLEPIELLDALQLIEQQQKRVRKEHWGPRTIDLDILLYNNITCQQPRLILPHPHMQERSFVLAPLADIAPELALPSGKKIQPLLTACGLEGVLKISR